MKPKEISDEDYEHAQKVFKDFACKNQGDYTGLYVRTDTFQFADVMENFIDVCLEKYKLDPVHCVTAASLAMDGMLKVTRVEIELLTDPDMYLFFKEGIRGGVSSAMKTYLKANNKYMKDYDPKEISKYIVYNDKNSLYTSVLCGPLLIRGFTWLTPEEINEMMEGHSKIKSCTLKVDLEFPVELHDLHNDYLLAVESVKVNSVKKLIPNLYNKEKYVVHHEALRCYLKYGMKLTKIHSGISYEECDFMKEFFDINAEARKVTKNEFEKDFYKRMNNNVFGKTMENVRNRSKINIVNGRNESRLLKLISKPNFRGAHIFEGSQLVSVRMRESTVILDKPIFVGQATLDGAKGQMYDWHYGEMKPKYGSNIDLGYTDTDSFIYPIRPEDYYEDIREDVPTKCDTSAYPEDHPPGLPRMNKNVPGLMKDEACGRIITKAICLRPKQYTYEIEEYDGMCEKEFCAVSHWRTIDVFGGDDLEKFRETG